jgi:hypothetical protein
MYYVYGLVDPTNNMVSYVGITGNTPHKRFVQHLSRMEREVYTPKGQWLNSLIDNGYFPNIVTLQTVDTEQQAQVAERWWIAHGQMIGWPLRNTSHFVKPGESQELQELSDPDDSLLPLPGNRQPTPNEAELLRQLYATLGSKNEVMRVAYGSKNGLILGYVNQALSEGGAA